jgi:CRISPR-associated endonuclease/helicase Cas3
VIEVPESDIPTRQRRQVTIIDRTGELLTSDVVRQALRTSPGRVLVVVNTVKRAVELYRELQDTVPKPVLLHSRFLPDDRKEKEENVVKDYSGNGSNYGLVIATQVIEVGMDISCDLLLTELAPIDSLIQRAGRCARWGGQGRVEVFGVEHHAPYDKGFVEETAKAVSGCSGERLTWELEKKLVDRLLAKRYKGMMDLGAGTRVLRDLSQAAFTGNPAQAERTVRETDLTVEVSIHHDPESLGREVFRLPRIGLPLSILRRFVKEKAPRLWEVTSSGHGESRVVPKVREVRNLWPGAFYILHPECAAYSQEVGLVLGAQGNSLVPKHEKERKEIKKVSQLETFQEHARNAIYWFKEKVYPKEGFALRRLAPRLGLSEEELLNLVQVLLILHDLGKLTMDWQRVAWETVKEWTGTPENLASLSDEQRKLVKDGEALLARFPEGDGHPPPHATISAYVVWDYLCHALNSRLLGEAVALVLAHHHSARTEQVRPYTLDPKWRQVINHLLSLYTSWQLPPEVEAKAARREGTALRTSMIHLLEDKWYPAYLILARCINLADRMAAGGGEDAVLDFEKWYGNL